MLDLDNSVCYTSYVYKRKGIMDKVKKSKQDRLIDYLAAAISLGILDTALAIVVFTSMKNVRWVEVASYAAIAALSNLYIVKAMWKNR